MMALCARAATIEYASLDMHHTTPPPHALPIEWKARRFLPMQNISNFLTGTCCSLQTSRIALIHHQNKGVDRLFLLPSLLSLPSSRGNANIVTLVAHLRQGEEDRLQTESSMPFSKHESKTFYTATDLEKRGKKLERGSI